MIKFWVERKKGGNCEVAIMERKGKSTFSFVNLTKGHICPCEFNSVEDAIEDLKNDPNVTRFTKI